MDYEKKYKEALGWMQSLYNGLHGKTKEEAELYFPELKESGDERIRKAIINVFASHADYEIFFGASVEDILAWLEKQGSQILANPAKTCKDEQKPIKEHDACDFCEDRYGCVNPCPTKLIDEQKPTDKVEPKFKVKKGEWYVCTDTFVSKGKIIAIKGQIYQSKQEDDTITCEDGCLFIDRHDGKASDYFRLWTIEDAKDGDVLCCKSGWTCIFKALDNHTNTFSSYCFMDSDKWFCNTGSECHTLDKAFIKAYNGEIYPASKEQRDLLFQKMKEEGYKWDAEKKELKKIADKSSWSEEDEKMYTKTIFALAQFMGNKDKLDWLKSIKDRVQPQPH